MVRESGSTTALSFDSLSHGNYEHLNALAKRWRSGKIQQRTQISGAKDVTMRLKDATGQSVEVSFPDLPGEDFARMWERRELDKSMLKTLTAPALVLLINGDTIRMPDWVVERIALTKKMHAQVAKKPTSKSASSIQKSNAVPLKEEPTEWSANLAPTQVRIVDLLQMLMSGDLDIGGRRLALLISAWDKVEGEAQTPAEILEVKMPLLNQYLRHGRDPWTWHVWGLSAQGGVYEDPEKDESFAETDRLRDLERPSDRIKVVDGNAVSSDITKPLEWLIT